MRVWIVNPFDNLPPEGNRPQRYWLMSAAFARAGHDVTLWTSDFSHSRKARRAMDPAFPDPGFRVKTVPTLSYGANICLSRVWSHLVLARRWARLAAAEERPGLVVASSPPLSLCAAARRFCGARGVPFVVDVMDAWPETFERVAPRLLLAPFARTARANYRAADAISAVSERYIDLVRSYGATAPARLFYHGIEIRAAAVSPPAEARGDGTFTIAYAGSMGASYDLATVIEAVKGMDGVRLELAGTGPQEPGLRALAAGCGRIVFHGYVGDAELRAMLARANAAVVPMFPASCVGVPYKLADYAAAGLPVLNSLEGETARLIDENGAGASYSAGDAKSFARALERLRRMDASRLRAGAARLARLFDADFVYGEYVTWASGLFFNQKSQLTTRKETR